MRLALVIAAVTLAFGCTEGHRLVPGLQSFAVQFTEGLGQAVDSAEPLGFISGKDCSDGTSCSNSEVCRGGRCSKCFSIDTQALGRDGKSFPFSGVLGLDVTPGFVSDDTVNFEMVDGAATQVEVCINRATGRTNLWVEHNGLVPRPADVNYGQCNDGLDNDGNGQTDLADSGCDDLNDNLEAPVTMSTGVSKTLLFDNPTVRQVQETGLIRTSPMSEQQVRVESGRLVVNNVVGNGFYVSDLNAADLDRPFNSLFVFTFSAPEGVNLGDAVCYFAGAVEEHVGHTQVIFPSYYTVSPVPAQRKSNWRERCGEARAEEIETFIADLKLPEPGQGKDLTDLLAVESGVSTNVAANSELLESYESALVKMRNIEVPTRLIACDRNDNGIIEDGDEINCRNQCQVDKLCTDLESFFEFRQFTGLMDKRKVVGVSVALASDFTPLLIDFLGQDDQQGVCTKEKTALGFLEYRCPARVLQSVTGALRHIYLCNRSTGNNGCGLQFWILDPRFDGDVVRGG